MTNPIQTNREYFHYTSGRWLWNEQQHLDQRYKWFDVSELKRVASRSVGADTCISMTKIAEGGFNKIFRLVMDNGRIVIARIPNPNAGPPFLTTASEVATMAFVKTMLVPCPAVIAWNADSKNPVHSEYILMEEAPGVGLERVWEDMSITDKLKIVDEVVTIEKKLMSISFSRYGSLYFAEDSFPGCVEAIVDDDVPQKDGIRSRFVVGPTVSRDFWDEERAHVDISRGPWTTPQKYLQAIVTREMAWISNHATPKKAEEIFAAPEREQCPETHIGLYQKFIKLIPFLLPREEVFVKSIMWHWDMHTSNIFVDGTTISSVIDWQGSWTGPACLQVRQPKLVDYNGNILLELPEGYKDIEDPSEKSDVRMQVEKSIVLWTYETETKQENPTLHRIFQMRQGRTIRDLVEFSKETWEEGLVPFQQSLIRVIKNWDDFDTGIPCPIHFTEAELEKHYEEGEEWNEKADFWDSLQNLVQRDGWTTNDDYEKVGWRIWREKKGFRLRNGLGGLLGLAST